MRHQDKYHEIPLKGRLLEIFEPILRVALHLGLPTDDIIEYAEMQKKQQRENLYGSVEAIILQEIYKEHIRYNQNRVAIKDIAANVYGDDNKGTQKVGYKLKDMGIPTKRITSGTIIDVTNKEVIDKLEYLYKKYNTAELMKTAVEIAEDNERMRYEGIKFYGDGVK